MAKTEKETTAGEPPKPKARHKATWATDKYQGGYNVRVVGPDATRFANREVPVTRKDGTQSMEKLTGLIWSGVDDDTKQPVALYGVESKPRDRQNESVEF